MTILWRPLMAVGHETIDADHQRLIYLINLVERSLTTDCSHQDLKGALDALVAYAREHFEREEGLMSAVRYVALAEHRQSHRELRLRLTEIAAEFEHAKSAAVSPTEKTTLINLLRSWLLDHLLKEDMRLKPLWSQQT